MNQHKRTISVIGLGYVGLPVASAFAATGQEIIAFDIDESRITELKKQHDRTGEIGAEALASPCLHFTTDEEDLQKADFHIITVPTPVTENHQPDMRFLYRASELVGRILKKGDIVIYESTVYPGATEEDCIPILEQVSGLSLHDDFCVGYSPERINPGDGEHSLTKTTKIVSACNDEALELIASVYGLIITAGIHKAPSIRVAEAAKVIENTQRDLNIALVNELAVIFDLMDIRTQDVLKAAETKWNFLPFSPGLVGGHCIGVDPYYLTAKAERLGYHPQIILSGRKINDSMGAFIAQKLLKLLAQKQIAPHAAKVAIFGLTFKENVKDLRNSRIPDITAELRQYGIEALIHDPLADAQEALVHYNVTLSPLDDLTRLDAVILAVPHDDFSHYNWTQFLNKNGIMVDIKSMLDPATLPASIQYWSL